MITFKCNHIFWKPLLEIVLPPDSLLAKRWFMQISVFRSGKDIFTFVQALIWTFHFNSWDLCWILPGQGSVSPQRQQKADVRLSSVIISWQPTPSRPLKSKLISTPPHILVPLGFQHAEIRWGRQKAIFWLFLKLGAFKLPWVPEVFPNRPPTGDTDEISSLVV